MKTIELTNSIVKESLKNNEYNTIRVTEVKISGKWIEKDVSFESFTDEEKDRFLSKDTLRWFKNLGGSETVKQGTFKGFGATINVSTSPSRDERRVTYFLF